MNIFPVQRFTVSGDSMFPILKPGQDILVWCWSINFKIGDVVVVRRNGREIIKRIQKIRKGQIFIVGDNLKESTDSRNFGWVDKKDIVGKVIWYQKPSNRS